MPICYRKLDAAGNWIQRATESMGNRIQWNGLDSFGAMNNAGEDF